MTIGLRLRKLSLVMCNNKGADLPAHPRSLISNSVIYFLRRIISRLETSIFKLAFLTEETGLRLALLETQKTGFSRCGPISFCCLLGSSRTNITSSTYNNIKKNNEEAVLQICNRGVVTLFGCALHHLIHKSFVTTAHRAGECQGLLFSGCRSLVWP